MKWKQNDKTILKKKKLLAFYVIAKLTLLTMYNLYFSNAINRCFEHKENISVSSVQFSASDEVFSVIYMYCALD